MSARTGAVFSSGDPAAARAYVVADIHSAPEPLLYLDSEGSSASTTTSRVVQAGQVYRLSVPKATAANAPAYGQVRRQGRVPASRIARVRLAPVAERKDAGSRTTAAAGSIEDLDLGVCLVASTSPKVHASEPRDCVASAEAAGEIRLRIGPHGSALDLFRFQITSAERCSGRVFALVGVWADGSPLPGADRIWLRVEAAGPLPAPVGGKRELYMSGGELRSGGFLGVTKRLRDVPPPLARPPPQPGTPPPAGLFDSDSLTAAALNADLEPLPRAPHSPAPLEDVGAAPAAAEVDLESELEALTIAKDIAGEDELAEIKHEELSPLFNAIGERKDVMRNIVRRTMEELMVRGRRTGRSHPSLASLTSLAKLLSELDAAGLSRPAPPPPSHTLFAMDVLEQPDSARVGEPLPGWFPPFDYGEKYVAAVEQAFKALHQPGASGPALQPAVSAAAARLTDDRLLLSPLVRTFAGRVRLRALLVILREAAVSMAPVARVANHLTMAALRRLTARARASDRDDAIRSAWDAVDALRPALRNAPPDLFPITPTRALEVLRLAADVASVPGAQHGSDPKLDADGTLLLAEALARIGEQESMAGMLHDGIEHLFEAWALLLRAGGSPSRLESRILVALTDAHMISPAACQLAERVYWCTESEEDLQLEARACCTLAHLSGAAGRTEEAMRFVNRVFEIEASMPEEHRGCSAIAYAAASVAIMTCVRTGHVEAGFSYARMAHHERLKLADVAHPALDSGCGGFRNFQGPGLDPSIEALRFGLFLYALCDPHGQTSIAESIAAMGEVHARQGQWRRAALCFAESLARSRPFRRAYPLDHPRILRLTAAQRRCEELARSAAAPGDAAGA